MSDEYCLPSDLPHSENWWLSYLCCYLLRCSNPIGVILLTVYRELRRRLIDAARGILLGSVQQQHTMLFGANRVCLDTELCVAIIRMFSWNRLSYNTTRMWRTLFGGRKVYCKGMLQFVTILINDHDLREEVALLGRSSIIIICHIDRVASTEAANGVKCKFYSGHNQRV